jgi:hypothetical protein
MYHLESLVTHDLLSEAKRIKNSLNEIIQELQNRGCNVSIEPTNKCQGIRPESLFEIKVQFPEQITI